MKYTHTHIHTPTHTHTHSIGQVTTKLTIVTSVQFPTTLEMASWVKKMLFRRQLSHGSDTEKPESFDEALQQQVKNIIIIHIP